MKALLSYFVCVVLCVAFCGFGLNAFSAEWLNELSYEGEKGLEMQGSEMREVQEIELQGFEMQGREIVEVIISYKLELENEVPKAERYRVSAAMNEAKKPAKSYECSVNVGDYDILDGMSFFILALLKREKEQVLECLYKGQMRLKEYGLWRDGRAISSSRLEIPPTRISAYLHNRELILRIPL